MWLVVESASHFPATQLCEAHCALAVQVELPGSGASHFPLPPQEPLAHWPELAQGDPRSSGASHLPPVQTLEAHSAESWQPAPLATGTMQLVR